MTRVYIADAKPEERSALRLLLLDLEMEIVGEAADWPTARANAQAACPDILLVEWALLPVGAGVPAQAQLRLGCPKAVIVVLINPRDDCQQAMLSAGADAFISKAEMPERVAERLRQAAAIITHRTLLVARWEELGKHASAGLWPVATQPI